MSVAGQTEVVFAGRVQLNIDGIATNSEGPDHHSRVCNAVVPRQLQRQLGGLLEQRTLIAASGLELRMFCLDLVCHVGAAV